jgi:hypothetical protein
VVWLVWLVPYIGGMILGMSSWYRSVNLFLSGCRKQGDKASTASIDSVENFIGIYLNCSPDHNPNYSLLICILNICRVYNIYTIIDSANIRFFCTNGII